MDPVAEGTTHEYTAVGNMCQTTAQRPYLRWVTTPPGGVSPVTWKTLQYEIYEGHRFRTKALSLACAVGCILITLPTYLLIYGDPKERQEDKDLSPALTLSGLALLLLMHLSLEGACHHAPVVNAIEMMQPSLREEGWDMQWHKRGNLFFVVVIVTMKYQAYQAPEAPVVA